MVKTTLVDSWIDAGRRLTEALDEANFQVVASFWLYDGETEEWRLVIASPLVGREGPLKAYRKVQTILGRDEGLRQLSLSDITVVDPDDSLIKSLRSAVRTGKGLAAIRFTRNRINDRFIEDAYIYRVT